MNKFDEKYLKKAIKTISDNYLKFLLCYKTFLKNKEIRNIDTHGEEKVSENLKVMNKYNSIFQILDFGMLDLATIELYKFFENKADTINIYSIINYIYGHRKKINELKQKEFDKKCETENKKEVFKELPLESVKEILGPLRLINDNFKEKAEEKIKNIEIILESLKNLRHNKSHNLKKLKKTNLTFDDFDKVQKNFEDLFNFINLNFHDGIYGYSHHIEIVERDYNLLLKNLYQYNKIRSIFFDNYLERLGKSDEEIFNEIKNVLKINF